MGLRVPADKLTRANYNEGYKFVAKENGQRLPREAIFGHEEDDYRLRFDDKWQEDEGAIVIEDGANALVITQGDVAVCAGEVEEELFILFGILIPLDGNADRLAKGATGVEGEGVVNGRIIFPGRG